MTEETQGGYDRWFKDLPPGLGVLPPGRWERLRRWFQRKVLRRREVYSQHRARLYMRWGWALPGEEGKSAE